VTGCCVSGRVGFFGVLGPSGLGRQPVARLLGRRNDSAILSSYRSRFFPVFADLKKRFLKQPGTDVVPSGTLLFVDEIHRFKPGAAGCVLTGMETYGDAHRGDHRKTVF